MRILIDLQAAQAGNGERGIGRYSLSLAIAMARSRGPHEVLIALNGFFPDTIAPIRTAFAGLLPPENVRVWHAVGPLAQLDARNDWRRRSAELVREAFLTSLKPDVVHVSSLFEGFQDDAVTSVGTLSRIVPTAVTLYDLIPYIHRDAYLQNPAFAGWYLEKLEHLRRADLWLAISGSSRREGIAHLQLPEARSFNISADADPCFRRLRLSPEAEGARRRRLGLSRPFVMYTGGIDHRKNVEGLIRAFARLPVALRRAHQLAVVCAVQPDSRRNLEQLAVREGLGRDEVVLTGFVPEDDLVALYNTCALFVFPSWHEGFGLPPLEAMRCGAPVIGGDNSSLPEVIGWRDALFDARSDAAIAAAMERALSDEAFRAELVRNGDRQSGKFSWDASAGAAIAAMEGLHRRGVAEPPAAGGRRPRLAYVSPLPPEKTGIADYSAELVPELARHYEIDVVVAQDQVTDSWIKANCGIRSARWFLEHVDRYDRVLYHFGNSPFHRYMFDLVEVVPGVTVLHEFYLSHLLAQLDRQGPTPGVWARELYGAHGYPALRERYHAASPADVAWEYPCSLGVIQASLGVIVHSAYPLDLARQWYGSDLSDWTAIPLMRRPEVEGDGSDARRALGYGPDDFLVCAFGIVGRTKLNHRLLTAWLKSRLAEDRRCHLVFVGENHGGDYGQELVDGIRASDAADRVRITGWTSREVFRRYLSAADLAVQLRARSRGETSAAVLDCMNHGLATVVNANGSMAHLDAEAVWMLPDEFSDDELADALQILREDRSRRRRMGAIARGVIRRDHEPHACAARYREAIERSYQWAAAGLAGLPGAVAALDGPPPADADLIQLADAIARSFPPRDRQRQLLVDVSELVQRDSMSGIQRVVRSVLSQWLAKPPPGLRVEPVYATRDEPGYRYARQFALRFLDCPHRLLEDEPLDYAPGDVFLGLDLQPAVVPAQRSFYQAMRRQGVLVKFVVYDLLPILLPGAFLPGASEHHRKWLEVVADSDGAVCISRAVADELDSWLAVNRPECPGGFVTSHFHLGADVASSRPTRGVPADADATLGAIRARTSFLMVGTIEPRKGHAQVLDAFEQLWRSGHDVALVVVGRRGWMVDDLVQRLCSHPERDRRLFWLEGISDEHLELVYAACACLVVASEGEGFGLPLIEAAQHGLPIVARDLPVFREVAGEHAHYFAGSSAAALADALRSWLALRERRAAPSSAGLRWLTWAESAEQLLAAALSGGAVPGPVPGEGIRDAIGR